MPFDRYMIQVGAALHPKFNDFTPAELCAWFLGALSLAARANPRGSLRVGDRPAEPKDVAKACGIRPDIARKTMGKARDNGLISMGSDGFEWVHDFEQWNPNPRSDATNAERQRRYRERRVTPDVTLRNAGEVKKLREEEPPTPFALRNGTGRSGKRPARSASPGPRSVDTAAKANKRFWFDALSDLPQDALAMVPQAIRALRLRGEPLTVEAVRNYITEGGEA